MGNVNKKALRMSGRHLSYTLKDTGKAAQGRKHASPYHMYSLELWISMLTTNKTLALLSSLPHKTLKCLPTPLWCFSLMFRSIANANSYFIYMEAFPNTKHRYICHTILERQRSNSIMWLNQFKWLMYKDRRMPPSFQLRANNCSIIS